jgi:hypothetical protein
MESASVDMYGVKLNTWRTEHCPNPALQFFLTLEHVPNDDDQEDLDEQEDSSI